MSESPQNNPEQSSEIKSPQQRVMEELRKIFPNADNKKFEALFKSSEPAPKPKTWSNKSNATYYREHYALQMRKVYDQMIAEFEQGIYEDCIFYYKDTPELSENSLYLKINQSKLYLLEQLDPDDKYKKFDALIRIRKEPNIGIRIFYRDSSIAKRDDNSPIDNPARLLIPDNQRTAINEIEDWLQTAKPKEALHLTKLFLSDENIRDIKASLCELDDIVYSIKHNEIKLRKLSEDEMTVL